MNSYLVTDEDTMAMIEIMKYAWHVKFSASRDKPGLSYTRRDGTYVKGLPPHTRWDIQAVNPVNGTYYTTDGDSIAEAVTKWFKRIGQFDPPEWNAAK